MKNRRHLRRWVAAFACLGAIAGGIVSFAPRTLSKPSDGGDRPNAFAIANHIVVESIDITNLPLTSVLEQLERIANEQSSTLDARLTLHQDQAIQKELPPLTFRGGYIPFPVLLSAIAETEGLECRYGDREIVFAEKDDNSNPFRGVNQSESTGPAETSPDNETQNGLSVRQWVVIPSNRSSGRGDEKDGTRWKRYFEEHGVDWPKGSKVLYCPDNGILSICNTADNLDAVDAIIKKLAKGNQ